MVTIDGNLQTQDGLVTVNKTFYGKSTDQKPTLGVGNGSFFIEIDTGKALIFDASTSSWIEPGA